MEEKRQKLVGNIRPAISTQHKTTENEIVE